MAQERFLEKLTWAEVAERMQAGIDAVLLPIGTTEQHGRHMPLDTDCVIARALSNRAAEAAAAEDLDVLVAPTLNVTLSWYHMQFPGSVRLRTDTFLRVFEEVCESLHHHGLDNVIAVNGHGGNVAALTVAVNRYFEMTGRRVFLLQWWELAADVVGAIEGPVIHAEEAETSLAMALGQRVLMEHAARDAYDRGAAVRDAGIPLDLAGQVRSHPSRSWGRRPDGHAGRHLGIRGGRRRDQGEAGDRAGDSRRRDTPNGAGRTRHELDPSGDRGLRGKRVNRREHHLHSQRRVGRVGVLLGSVAQAVATGDEHHRGWHSLGDAHGVVRGP